MAFDNIKLPCRYATRIRSQYWHGQTHISWYYHEFHILLMVDKKLLTASQFLMLVHKRRVVISAYDIISTYLISSGLLIFNKVTTTTSLETTWKLHLKYLENTIRKEVPAINYIWAAMALLSRIFWWRVWLYAQKHASKLHSLYFELSSPHRLLFSSTPSPPHDFRHAKILSMISIS